MSDEDRVKALIDLIETHRVQDDYWTNSNYRLVLLDKTIESIKAAFAAIRADERERCAEVVEGYSEPAAAHLDDEFKSEDVKVKMMRVMVSSLRSVAQVIRSRKD